LTALSYHRFSHLANFRRNISSASLHTIANTLAGKLIETQPTVSPSAYLCVNFYPAIGKGRMSFYLYPSLLPGAIEPVWSPLLEQNEEQCLDAEEKALEEKLLRVLHQRSTRPVIGMRLEEEDVEMAEEQDMEEAEEDEEEDIEELDEERSSDESEDEGTW